MRTTLAPLASTPAAARGPACSRPARIDSTPGRASASRRSSAPRLGPTALGASAMAAGTDSTTTSAAGVSATSGSLTCVALAASSSMPMRSIAGRIWRCSSSPPSTLTWMPSAERTSTPDTDGGVDPVGAQHPVEVDHADHARIGARHLPHQRVVGLHAGRRVLRPGQAVGLAVTGVDVGHGEQHHFGTKRVEDGDGRLQVGRQVLVPGGLADVHPVPVEQVVGDLPAAEAQGDHLGPLSGHEERPQAAPVVAARRGRPGRARGEHLELRVEVAAEGGVVGHA